MRSKLKRRWKRRRTRSRPRCRQIHTRAQIQVSAEDEGGERGRERERGTRKREGRCRRYRAFLPFATLFAMAERRGVAEGSTQPRAISPATTAAAAAVVAGGPRGGGGFPRHREGTWRQTGGRAPALARPPREPRQSGAHLPGADSAPR